MHRGTTAEVTGDVLLAEHVRAALEENEYSQRSDGQSSRAGKSHPSI